MSALVDALLDGRDDPAARVVYGVATGANTVKVAGSTVAVTLPALSPVIAGDYVAVLSTGADRLILGRVGGATAWTAPTLVNSWVNYESGFARAAYRRVGDVVSIRGVVKSGTGLIFTLPVGFRPPDPEQFPVVSNGAFGYVQVGSSGGVSLVSGSNAYVALAFSFTTAPGV